MIATSASQAIHYVNQMVFTAERSQALLSFARLIRESRIGLLDLLDKESECQLLPGRPQLVWTGFGKLLRNSGRCKDGQSAQHFIDVRPGFATQPLPMCSAARRLRKVPALSQCLRSAILPVSEMGSRPKLDWLNCSRRPLPARVTQTGLESARQPNSTTKSQ